MVDVTGIARRMVRRELRRRGREVVSWPNPAGLPAALRKAIDRLGIALVLDVGAFEGQFADLLRTTVDYRGTIISFEPSPASAGPLTARAGLDPSWHVRNQAVGDAAGLATLHVYENASLSSLHAPSDFAQERWNFGASTDVQVEVVTLESCLPALIAEHGRPALLKIDAQGHDLAVLRGAGDCIEDVELILTEVAVEPLYPGVPRFSATVSAIEAFGYEPLGFWPIVTEEQGHHSADDLRVIEFDGLFRRRTVR